MVSAWATANHISLGQTVVDEKSNAITAIPKLLKMIDVSGGLLTIEAMGCQTEIAAKIVDKGADYCLALKGNEPTLHEGIKEFFLDHLEDDFARIDVGEHHTKETDHGRVDERRYYLCETPDDLSDAGRWKDLCALGMSINNTQRRKGDENFITLWRTDCSLLKQEKTAKCGIKNKRLTAGWDEDYMEKVVFSQ